MPLGSCTENRYINQSLKFFPYVSFWWYLSFTSDSLVFNLFWVLFVPGEKQWSSVSLLCVWMSSLPSSIFWRVCPSEKWTLWVPSCKLVGWKSVPSYFCNLCVYLGLCCMPVPCCLGYNCSTVSSEVPWCLWDCFSPLLWHVVFYNSIQISGFFSRSLKTVIDILEGIKIWACTSLHSYWHLAPFFIPVYGNRKTFVFSCPLQFISSVFVIFIIEGLDFLG